MEKIGFKVTLADGMEILVRQHEDGTLEADTRNHYGQTWSPVALWGGTVEKVDI